MKYSVDAFEGIAELQEAASGDELRDGHVDDDDSAEEFQARPDELPDEAEDVMSGDEGGVDEVGSNGAASDTGEQLMDDISVASDPDVGASSLLEVARGAQFKKKTKKTKGQEDDLAFTRGLPEGLPKSASKAARRLYFFGPARDDYEPVYKAQAKWVNDPTLPRRSNAKGLVLRLPGSAEEIHGAWKWWHEGGGREAFGRRQTVRILDIEEAAEYMLPAGEERIILMGPYTNPTLYTLPVRQTVPLREAWGADAITNDATYKNGFMLNLGARVHCLNWLPGRSEKHQYLAASVLPSRPSSFDASSAPAFNAQPSYNSSIQIWKFEVNEDGSMRVNGSPQLSTVLCTRWSDIKSLEWCPTPTADGDPKLLATITADGAIRVVEVSLSSSIETTRYQLIENVAFQSRPPNTICTCVTWLGPSRIAAGCANGCIAVWNIDETPPDNNPDHVQRPYIYSSISTSYIASIASCYPSHPNMLITNSMTGYTLLTDISRPHTMTPAATTTSQRARVAQTPIHWSDWAQAAVGVDDSFLGKMYPLRRWFTTINICRTKSLATAIAGSPCHPHVLFGTASGEVLSTNPLGRMIKSKAEVWQQTWFAHEWRRPTLNEANATLMPASPESGGPLTSKSIPPSVVRGIGANGLSRITEGFKAERVYLAGDEHAVPNSRDYNMFHTVYEQQSAITSLAWNPNPHVAGWAAAGMADGLLRVEDIAI